MTDREERERQDHIRRWAHLMILHLERAEEGYVYTFQESLVRLRELIDRELERAGEPPAAAA